MRQRGSGLLLHISSLPTRYGIGDLGPEAYAFADFLSDAGQKYWQILPLNPMNPLLDHSPYLSTSAFAFNPLLISPDLLVRAGLLSKRTCQAAEIPPSHKVPFQKVILHKKKLLGEAYATFRSESNHEAFDAFCQEQAWWLQDYVLFETIKNASEGKAWSRWKPALRDRDEPALNQFQDSHADDILKLQFYQWLFYQQYHQLRSYCQSRQIQIIGDIPIYVAYDSADVWAHPHLFKLGDDLQPTAVAGVPPDYFSETGQLWGNPVYRWDVMQLEEFRWWNGRIAHNLRLFDQIRIDHFRGLVAYWEVPAHEKTAIRGRWVQAPVYPFLEQLFHHFPDIKLIAEDLGIITQDVVDVMEKFNLPGMKVLMFAFGEDMPQNPYIPHNLHGNCVLYTGTHDNNTLVGWFRDETDADMRLRIEMYAGCSVKASEVAALFIRMAMQSVADIVIFPVQDILGLGRSHRMNTPSVKSGNWAWRLKPGMLTDKIASWLAEMVEVYGR